MKKMIMVLLLCTNVFASGQVGDKAISFTLPNLHKMDKTISLVEQKGKVVLFNLWASWCGGCKEEMPLFVKLQNKFDKDKFVVITSSIDEDSQNAISFLKKVDKKKVLTALYDKAKMLPKAYKCMGMPTSYLIDKNGQIIETFVGSINGRSMIKLENSINSLLGK